MKTKLEYAMQSLIFDAKLLLESRHCGEDQLKWLYNSIGKPIDNIEKLVTIHTLNSSKILGYIIASYPIKKVMVLDENFSHLLAYEVKEEGII